MTTQARTSRLPTRSTLLAFGMLVGAAAFAWYGLRPQPAPVGGPEASAAATVTLPAGEETPPESRLVRGAGLPTRVVVERLGIDASISEVGVVVEDGEAAWETAWRAAGHHLNSAMPGQLGNLVLSGHVSVADPRNVAVFSALEQAAPGDVVEVHAGETVYRYAVEQVMVVPPTAVDVLRSDHRSTMTLITCTRDLKNRVVVVGSLL